MGALNAIFRARPRARASAWVSLRRLAGTCGCLALGLAGCLSPDLSGSREPGGVAAQTDFWKPYLLFQLAAPHRRLYVEVDAVEGMVPDDGALRQLSDFLSLHCSKPAGIQVVRDTVIPRSTAQGVAPKALARKFMSGPPSDPGAPPAAYIYVLLIDTALARSPSTNTVPEAGRSVAASSLSALPIAHAELLPYPAAILFDPMFGGRFRNTAFLWQVFAPVLHHEAGHLLGLSRNPSHAKGLHCLDSLCVMHPTHDDWALVAASLPADLAESAGLPRLRLCGDCTAELRTHSQEPSPSNLQFLGPVFVRSETGYHVMALPGRLRLTVGELEAQDAADFLKAVNGEALVPLMTDSTRWTSVVKPGARQDPILLQKTLKRAQTDPYAAVRAAAQELINGD